MTAVIDTQWPPTRCRYRMVGLAVSRKGAFTYAKRFIDAVGLGFGMGASPVSCCVFSTGYRIREHGRRC